MAVRLLLGKDLSGTYCLRVALPGFNALTDNPIANPERFSFASDWGRTETSWQVGTGVLLNPTYYPSNYIVGFDYPSPGYRPMFSVLRRPTSQSVEEQQFVQVQNIDYNPYGSDFIFWVDESNKLKVTPNYIGTIRSAYPHLFDYVIWRLRGEGTGI